MKGAQIFTSLFLLSKKNSEFFRALPWHWICIRHGIERNGESSTSTSKSSWICYSTIILGSSLILHKAVCGIQSVVKVDGSFPSNTFGLGFMENCRLRGHASISMNKLPALAFQSFLSRCLYSSTVCIHF